VHPEASPAAQRPRKASQFNRLVFHTLAGSLALYPLLEQFVKPVLAVAFAMALAGVVLRLIGNGFKVPKSFVWHIWASFTVVYFTWVYVAVLHGNDSRYISQDSFGFLLYFAALPTLYLYIANFGLRDDLFQFAEGCCTLIAIVSVGLVGIYYTVFGEVDFDSLAMVNLGIRNFGLTWQIDHNNGILGLYTYTGHLLLIGLALVLNRHVHSHRPRDLVLAGLYLVAIVLDGHRALVVAAVLQLLLMTPTLMSRLRSAQRIAIVAGALVSILTVTAVGADWMAKRFDFSEEDVSTSERHAQTPALLEKIEENPILGGGFGTVASYIRSAERPFSYEVDFLATAMKLGIVGTLIYFGTYFYALAHARRHGGRLGRFLFAAGVGFFFYMGSNGNQAMSTDSAVFHILMFLMIAFSAKSSAQGTATVRPSRRTFE